MEKSSSVISLMIPLLDAALFEGQGTLYVCEELEEANNCLIYYKLQCCQPEAKSAGVFLRHCRTTQRVANLAQQETRIYRCR